MTWLGVTQVREEVAALGVGASESEIRNVRRLITQSQQTEPPEAA